MSDSVGLPSPDEAGFDGDLEALLDLIRDERGFDFTGYKRPSLTRRIRKRMQEVGVDSFAEYASVLKENPDEFVALFNTILINVTELLRDRDAWEFLQQEIFPRLAPRLQDEGQLRVWSAGCATGEEAYTLAVLVAETVGEEAFRGAVKIYATDADDEALRQARQARFPLRLLVDAFGKEAVEKYFERVDAGYGLRADLRRSLIFGRHDLMQDPPISRVDLLVCRNTLMYFNADVQRRILANFHFALSQGGYLFLGQSEALATRTNLFTAVDVRRHVFQKHPRAPASRPPLPPPPAEPVLQANRQVTGSVVDAAYDAGIAAQITVDLEGNVVAANRQARVMLGIGMAQIGKPLRDLELSYRPVELRGPIEQVSLSRRPITISDVEHHLSTGDVVYLEITVVPVERGGVLLGANVTFVDVTRGKQLREELERSQREVEIAYEELQSTVEELETTNEELQSTNEELETTNEELHSTNEELETMNEELQSTNEELETVNTELRQRTHELDAANRFFESVLGSIQAGVAVLDREMVVHAWNRGAEELWGLRSDEAIGQHFLNLDIGLPVGEVRGSIRRKVAGEDGQTRQVVRAVNRRGREISCTVDVAPLMSTSAVTGVIVMMEGGADDEASR